MWGELGQARRATESWADAGERAGRGGNADGVRGAEPQQRKEGFSQARGGEPPRLAGDGRVWTQIHPCLLST